MAKVKEKTSVKEQVPKELETSKYINPLTDFGFKYLFNEKMSMLNFLNAILNIKGGILD